MQSWQKAGQILLKSTGTCIMCSILLQLLTPHLQFVRQVQVRSEILPMILFAAFSLARPFSPAFGTISLPGRVAIKPTAIFAEQLSLCNVDPSCLLSPHPSQIHSFTCWWTNTVQYAFTCLNVGREAKCVTPTNASLHPSRKNLFLQNQMQYRIVGASQPAENILWALIPYLKRLERSFCCSTIGQLHLKKNK